MRPLHTALVAATLATLPALAQQTATPPGTATGFFAPQPNGDPSLTHTLPPEAYQPASAPVAPRPSAQPQAPSAPAAPVTGAPANGAPLVVVVPDPNAAARRTEEQMDRAREEADRARAATANQPPHINGAFTGLTDERDR